MREKKGGSRDKVVHESGQDRMLHRRKIVLDKCSKQNGLLVIAKKFSCITEIIGVAMYTITALIISRPTECY